MFPPFALSRTNSAAWSTRGSRYALRRLLVQNQSGELNDAGNS
jgi:hypothetical protein